MIVNHQYSFIFVKTRKTAGSSAEIGLSRACRPGDIVSALSAQRGEEQLRRAEGGYGPAGWQKGVTQHSGLREWWNLLARGRRAVQFRGHATATELQKLLGPEIWNRYFKFTLERNPWDRAVSRYWWQKHRWEQRGRNGFPTMYGYFRYLEQDRPHWLSNWGHYAISDHLVVDRVLFYENLDAELEQLRVDLDIDEDIALPRTRAKSGHRPGGQDYRDVLGPKERNLIARVCAKEIEAFGYVF